MKLERHFGDVTAEHGEPQQVRVNCRETMTPRDAADLADDIRAALAWLKDRTRQDEQEKTPFLF